MFIENVPTISERLRYFDMEVLKASSRVDIDADTLEVDRDTEGEGETFDPWGWEG